MTRKTTLLVICILIVAVAPIWLATAQRRGSSRRPKTRATVAGWYTFIGPDGDFSLAFPAKPERSNSDAEGPVTSIRHYQVSTKAGKYFSINL
jgi:hypothetical protein